MKNKYPIYILSKNRWNDCKTAELLNRLGADYHIVIEEEQIENYAKNFDRDKFVIIDKQYQEDYDTCDDLGFSKSKGSGPARNFAWDHSIKTYGSKWHWIMDDNIYDFHRLNKSKKVAVRTFAWFRAQEDFVDRYKNIAVAGPNYSNFAHKYGKNGKTIPPLHFNTKVYSCMMVRNDIPFRWRARYNEDVDLCLRVLKEGWCTVLFNAFLADKATTLKIKGGNSQELYDDGKAKMEKSQMLEHLHPDVARVTWRFNRWHHWVDWKAFRKNYLEKVDNIVYPEDPEYGMKLIDIGRENVGTRAIDDHWE